MSAPSRFIVARHDIEQGDVRALVVDTEEGDVVATCSVFATCRDVVRALNAAAEVYDNSPPADTEVPF